MFFSFINNLNKNLFKHKKTLQMLTKSSKSITAVICLDILRVIRTIKNYMND